MSDSKEEKPKIFIVIGMPRCGTTYLFQELARHPSIFVPFRKESYYFSSNYAKGLNWFRELYSDMKGELIGADINPMYFLDPSADRRILDYDPDVKIVLGIREPVDFTESLYQNMHMLGLDINSVNEILDGYAWRLTPDSVIDCSFSGNFLSNRIKSLKETFGDNLLLYDFAEFSRGPLPVLSAIERFLEIPPFFDVDNIQNLKINAAHRRDVLGMNSLLTNQKFLDFIYAILPRALVRKLRSAYEKISVAGKSDGDADELIDSDERGTLVAALAADREFYHDLFKPGSIQLGSGRIFSLDQ